METSSSLIPKIIQPQGLSSIFCLCPELERADSSYAGKTKPYQKHLTILVLGLGVLLHIGAYSLPTVYLILFVDSLGLPLYWCLWSPQIIYTLNPKPQTLNSKPLTPNPRQMRTFKPWLSQTLKPPQRSQAAPRLSHRVPRLIAPGFRV